MSHHHHHYHHHLSLNREGRWGTRDDFVTSLLHFFPYSPLPLGLEQASRMSNTTHKHTNKSNTPTHWYSSFGGPVRLPGRQNPKLTNLLVDELQASRSPHEDQGDEEEVEDDVAGGDDDADVGAVGEVALVDAAVVQVDVPLFDTADLRVVVAAPRPNPVHVVVRVVRVRVALRHVVVVVVRVAVGLRARLLRNGKNGWIFCSSCSPPESPAH